MLHLKGGRDIWRAEKWLVECGDNDRYEYKFSRDTLEEEGKYCPCTRNKMEKGIRKSIRVIVIKCCTQESQVIGPE